MCFKVYSLLNMRIQKKYIVKGRPPVYVVVRDGRRTEEQDYTVKHMAEERADILMSILKKYDPLSRVSIIHTSQPERIK